MGKPRSTVMRIGWLYVATLILALLVGAALFAPSPALAQDSPSTCDASGDDNDLLYCVWLVEPRFAGMSVDQSDANVLRVLLTGDGPHDAAGHRVLAEVNRLWNREFTGFTVANADYTIGELKGWFDTVAADFHEQMTGVDLDEYANRITVMVVDLDADQDTVADHVAGLGVPSAALVVREDRLLLPDPAPEPQVGIGFHTGLPQGLQTGLDPFVGGGEIYSWDGSAGDSCTLGFPIAFFNAEGRYEQGFITAGHCDRGDPFFGYGYAGHAITWRIWAIRNEALIPRESMRCTPRRRGPFRHWVWD